MKIVDPILAATIILLRDSERGLEVLMLTKARGTHFAAGALVFPGGKVDPKDKAFIEVSDSINTCQVELKVTAIREMYEECGILLARHKASKNVISSSEAVKYAGRDILDMARSELFELATDQLVQFAHWITPLHRPRRFDTHFFIAPAPDLNANPIVDGYEIVDAQWFRPSDILIDVYAGTLKLVLPTMMNVLELSRFRGVSQVLKATNKKDIFCVVPRPIITDEGPQFYIPEEAGYGITTVPSKFLRSS